MTENSNTTGTEQAQIVQAAIPSHDAMTVDHYSGMEKSIEPLGRQPFGDEEFTPFFGVVVRWFSGAYAQAELKFIALYFELKSVVQDKLQYMQSGELLNIAVLDLRAAKDELSTDIRGIAKTVVGKGGKNRKRIKELKKQIAELQRQQANQIACMTGDEKATIIIKSWLWDAAIVFTFVALLGVLDYFTGFEIFRFAGDSRTAAAFTISTILALIGSSMVAAHNNAKVISHGRFEEDFQANFVTGKKTADREKDSYGQPVKLLQLSPLTETLAKGGIKCMWFSIIGIVAIRIIASQMGDKRNAMMGFASIFFMVAITILAYYVKMALSSKHEKVHLDGLSEINELLEEAEDELEELMQPEEEPKRGWFARTFGPKESDVPTDPYASAKEKYTNRVSKIREAHQARLQDVRALFANHTAAYDSLKEFWATMVTAYQAMIKKVINAVFAAHPEVLPANHNFTSKAVTQPITDLFRSSVSHQWADEGFDRQIRSFNFNVALPPVEIVTEFSRLVETIEGEVKISLELDAAEEEPETTTTATGPIEYSVEF